MQKHSDRPDKRPPIAGLQGAAAGAAAAGANASAAAAASAAAVAAAHHAYDWQKVGDPYGHDRVVADYGAGLVDPRLNPHHRDMDEQRHPMDDMRHQTGNGQIGGAGSGSGGYGGGGGGVDAVKTSSSAFSPIQGAAAAGMLNSATMAASSRNYFYDPLTFPRNNSQVILNCRTTKLEQWSSCSMNMFQVGFNSRPGGAALHNQLISLSDIRNYARQPAGLFESLREGAGQVTQ